MHPLSGGRFFTRGRDSATLPLSARECEVILFAVRFRVTIALHAAFYMLYYVDAEIVKLRKFSVSFNNFLHLVRTDASTYHTYLDRHVSCISSRFRGLQIECVCVPYCH